MRAPAEFVVLRHLLTHPEDPPAQVAKHTRLRLDSVVKVLKRLEQEETWTREQLLGRARSLSVKPKRRDLHFFLPDPKQWLKAYQAPYLVSGELAAAEADHFNLRPAQLLVYVPPQHATQAAKTALDLGADLAGRSQGNLTLREADPWLANDDADEHLAERGQRLLDYAESPQIQMLQGLRRSD